MTHVCPECGYNLRSLDGLQIGPLSINRGSVTWHGMRPHLTPTENLIVQAIAGCDGNPIKVAGLVEAIGSEATDPVGNIGVLIHRIRKAFLAVDPDFTALETVRANGYRWNNMELLSCST